MKCAKTKLASPHIDNELSEKDKDHFEAHLATCHECGARIQALQKARSLFSQAERYQAPYAFTTRVMARAAAQKRTKVWRLFPTVARLAEVAVVLVMILVGVLAGRFVMNSVMHQRMGNIASTFSLDLFDSAPPDSVGGAYLAMTEAVHEQ
jgi:anti-sigma factor RsiW